MGKPPRFSECFSKPFPGNFIQFAHRFSARRMSGARGEIPLPGRNAPTSRPPAVLGGFAIPPRTVPYFSQKITPPAASSAILSHLSYLSLSRARADSVRGQETNSPEGKFVPQYRKADSDKGERRNFPKRPENFFKEQLLYKINITNAINKRCGFPYPHRTHTYIFKYTRRKKAVPHNQHSQAHS